MPDIFKALGSNAGTIGTGIGAGIGQLFGVPGVGGAIGGGIGGLFQTGSGNPNTSASHNNPATGTALAELIAKQKGRNIPQEVYDLLAPLLTGSDQITQGHATRGAGKNAFGTFLLQGLAADRRQAGTTAVRGVRELTQDQFSALQQLTQMHIGANNQGIQNQFAAITEGNNRRDSFFNSLYGATLEYGAEKRSGRG